MSAFGIWHLAFDIRSRLWLAAAAGFVLASCATMGAEEAALLERGTPRLDRLLGASLSDIYSRPGVLIAAAQADKALEEGRHGEALAHLDAAAKALPEDASVCHELGSLLYLKGVVASVGAGSSDTGWSDLEEKCVAATVSGEEMKEQLFFKVMVSGEESTGTSHPGEETPPPEVTTAQQELAIIRRAQTFEQAGRSLGGPRGEALLALSKWTMLSGEKEAGPCDAGFAERNRVRKNETFLLLEKLGRPDLAAGTWAGMGFGPDGVDQAALEGVVAWVDRAENRWLRTYVLARALTTARYAASWADPMGTVPLCARLFADLSAQVASDHADGFNGRNVGRLMDAFNASGACLHQEQVAALTRAVLDAAKAGPDGASGVLQVLGTLAVHVFVAVLEGRQDLLGMVLQQLPVALDDILSALSDSPEDRALAALLLPVQSLPSVLTGDWWPLVNALEQSAAALDILASQPLAPDAPKLVRLVPGIRATAVGALALILHLAGENYAAADAFQRLEEYLEGDISALLKALEQPDHSAEILKLYRAIRWFADTLASEGIPIPQDVVAAIEEASKPGTDEKDWWALGLDAARFVAWDLVALVASDRNQKELAEAALTKAEALSENVVHRLVGLVEIPPAVRAFLQLLPSLHRLIPDLASQDLPSDQLWQRAADVLDEPLKKVLEESAASTIEQTPEARFISDLLTGAAKVGLGQLVREPKQAVAQLADFLEQASGHHAPDVATLLSIVVAAARSYAAPEKAPEAFRKASLLAKKHMPRLGFLPDAIEAGLTSTQSEDLARVLEPLDRALAEGDTALGCGKAGPVHALLPYKVYALERLGRTKEAAEAYDLFTKLTESGFPGDSRFGCYLESSSSGFITTATVSSSIAGLLLVGKQEGTFQLGLGSHFGGDGGSGDSLRCDVYPLAGPRLDRILEAHLAYAVYSMLRGDDVAAHKAILRALAAGRTMVNGSSVTMGTAAGPIAESMRMVSLPMLTWTSALAKLRGHRFVAGALSEVTSLAAQAQGKFTPADMLEPDDAPPLLLRGFPQLDSFGPLVKRLIDSSFPAPEETAALDKNLAAWGKKSRSVPQWGVELENGLSKQFATWTGEKSPAWPPLPLPRDPTAATLVSLTNIYWAYESGAPLDTDKLKKVATAAVKAGFPGEVVQVSLRMAGAARRNGKPGDALALLDATVELLPQEPLPLLAGPLVAMQAEVLLELQLHSRSLDALKLIIPSLSGSLPAVTELTFRWHLIRYLGAFGDFDAVAPELEEFLPMVLRGYGASDPLYFSLLAVRLALRLPSHDVPDETLSALVDFGKSVPGAEDAVDFLTLLRTTPDPAQRKRLSSDYLSFIFQGGPAP